MEDTVYVNGIEFTNLVNSKEKERAIKSTYVPNEGKPYSFEASISGSAGYFARNIVAIKGAFALLQGK